ncbi:hypothetical protein KFE25_009023 [Diacronema lutheri]|uniref:fructokinase n=2 Tax=Diacronema lutheri TaxID=2081491 RepID=A0A8J6CD52_DIALT|nr:hypothetical protein KFE25_009023 [Diacronema lutheri]
MRLAAVELGGTSIRVAIAEGNSINIVARESFPCDAPEVTLGKVRAWLAVHPFDALGVASFGPIEVRKSQPKYGFITTTPKHGWVDVDVLGGIGARALNVPVAFDTDVNAPAVSEYRAAAATDPTLTSCAYITIGTGVGVGLVVNGLPVHGMLHPEGGHCLVPNAPGDSWQCPLDLRIPSGVEARVSAPALASRAGVSQSELGGVPDSDPMWDFTAHYIATLCANLALLVSVERIVLGGGVMARESLYPKVRARCRQLLNGYLQCEQLLPQNIDSYIVPPAHRKDAGLIGALTLARDALLASRAEKARARGAITSAASCAALVSASLLAAVLLGRRF